MIFVFGKIRICNPKSKEYLYIQHIYKALRAGLKTSFQIALKHLQTYIKRLCMTKIPKIPAKKYPTKEMKMNVNRNFCAEDFNQQSINLCLSKNESLYLY